MSEHWPVALIKDVSSDLDHKIRADGEDVRIERSMMELAQGQAVRYHGFTSRMAVREDVRRIDKFRVSQLAYRALASVGVQHPLSEDGLMKSSLRHTSVVGATGVLRDRRAEVWRERLRFGKGDREGECCRVITHHVDGPRGKVVALRDALEVRKRHLFDHRLAETSVLAVVNVRAAIPVDQQSIRRHAVFVRAFTPLDNWRRSDAQRDRLQHSRLEDALLADERDPPAMEHKAAGQ